MPKNLIVGSVISPSKNNSNQGRIDQYLRQSQLLKNHLPFSASTLWRKVRNGDFPAPVKLSQGITAWNQKDVTDWLDEQVMRCKH